MIKSLFTKLRYQVSKQKVAGIFISDSPSCPFWEMFLLAQKSKSLNVVHLRSNNITPSVTKFLSKKNKILIFVHGDKARKECFYRTKRNNFDAERFIPNSWWSQLITSPRLIYLHACHGAVILEDSRGMEGNFLPWISYLDEIVFSTGVGYISSLNLQFINSLFYHVTMRKGLQSLKAAMDLAYQSLIVDLLDSDDTLIPGRGAIIIQVGLNQKSLKSS